MSHSGEIVPGADPGTLPVFYANPHLGFRIKTPKKAPNMWTLMKGNVSIATHFLAGPHKSN